MKELDLNYLTLVLLADEDKLPLRIFIYNNFIAASLNK
jgi:hypothetical protein